MLKKLPKLNFNVNPRALLIVLGTLFIGLLLGWTLRGALLSPANVVTSARFEDWRTECAPRDQADGGCEMFEIIADGQTRNPVARLAFAEQDGQMLLAVTLSHNVWLEPGIGLAFGTDEVKVYQFRLCNLAGCVVTVPVDDALAAQLNAADKGRLVFAGLDQKSVGFDFSMHGYHEALAALKGGNAKRQSLWWRLWS